MNHILIRLSLFIIICIQLGCNSKTEDHYTNSSSYSVFDTNTIPIGEPAIICGTIHNLEVYPHVKEVTLEIPDFKGYENKHTTLITPDGSFYFKIYPVITREIFLHPVSDIVIVHPGDSICIEKDFKEINKVKFTGDASNLNNNVYKFHRNYLGRYLIQVNNHNANEYKKCCDDYRNESMAQLAKFTVENESSEEFVNWAKTTINSDYYITLLEYSRHFIRSLDDIDRTNIEEISFYDFLDSLEQNFNKSIICSNYFPLISIYQNNFIIPLIIEKYMGEAIIDHKRDSLFLEELSGHSENDLLNQFVLSNQYNQFLTNHYSELFEENKNFIENTIKEPFLLKTLADRYSFVKDYMTNPASLSDAMLGETDFINESIYFSDNSPIRKNLLKSLINSNKNKVIYIDFWAEWCPACIPELIESKKLQTKYKEKDIEFIYICLSDSTKAKEKIKEIEIDGKHYYLNPNESRYFQKTLGFWGVPNYLLIDRNGTIVDFGRVIRPSYPGTIKKIDFLLNE